MLKLKQFREEKGLSLVDVAKRLNVSRITVWNYESGKRKPSFDVLVQLAKIYGCSVNDFVEATEKENV